MSKIRKQERYFKKRFGKNPIQKVRKSFRRFWCKIHVVMICSILSMTIYAGCGREVSVLKKGAMEDSSQTENASDNSAEKQNTRNEQNDEKVLSSDAKNPNVDNPEEIFQNEEDKQENLEHMIYVDVGGAVKSPGVYALEEGSRVFEVIALAGGFAEDAYIKVINQAQILNDGEQIYVYTNKEAEELISQGGLCGSVENHLNEQGFLVQENSSSGKVNLNMADKEDLMTLNGIGETRAEAILQYRMEHGLFRSIEELMQVDGIKGKTYDKIKDCITIQ